MNRVLKLTVLIIVFGTQYGNCLDMPGLSRHFMPFWDNTDLYNLLDRTYFFPANRETDDPTVYMPLRKWDIIFTGVPFDNEDTDPLSVNVSRIIPGPINHIMVYMGKDSKGLAYAVELNIYDLLDPGGLEIVCLGSDYGILRDPLKAEVVDRTLMQTRWAMRFREQEYQKILDAEDVLLSRIDTDLLLGFPYQLEMEHSGSILDRNVYLVDDGFENGSSCSDYWTALFEEYAGICFKNVRLDAEAFEEYFNSDPEGMLAYAPPELSPFSFPITVRALLGMGYSAIDDEPHVFSCDGSQETGVVIPSLIIQSDLLEEIPYQDLGFSLPGFILQP